VRGAWLAGPSRLASWPQATQPKSSAGFAAVRINHDQQTDGGHVYVTLIGPKGTHPPTFGHRPPTLAHVSRARRASAATPWRSRCF
jgi:hypothetical protein